MMWLGNHFFLRNERHVTLRYVNFEKKIPLKKKTALTEIEHANDAFYNLIVLQPYGDS